ncbi:hypothetical protein CC80DRAFT_179882 [Byssothecium circinans]|uniref:Uncharacterized protein n=1 Tax=Byssothecium circinans TaxID=147558 RepID=A0A6A5TJQ6_9PLEO|nr:hypothetical protein CC80DRAFT_179882 [Byssothecium circinans]
MLERNTLDSRAGQCSTYSAPFFPCPCIFPFLSTHFMHLRAHIHKSSSATVQISLRTVCAVYRINRSKPARLGSPSRLSHWLVRERWAHFGLQTSEVGFQGPSTSVFQSRRMTEWLMQTRRASALNNCARCSSNVSRRLQVSLVALRFGSSCGVKGKVC